MQTESLWTANNVKTYLGVCRRTVDNLVKSKSLPVIRVGRCLRFDPADVQAFKKAHRVEAIS